jgi:predicted DCC family thiol-disulfide oxidoreductase YuxK
MQQTTSHSLPRSAPITVFYDGACPLCQREIGYYRRLSEDGSVLWVDVEAAGACQLPGGLEKDHALARFHVQTAGGQVLSGANAFIALWAHIPGFQWLAKIARLPPLPWVLERAYRGFLLIRPTVQRALRR